MKATLESGAARRALPGEAQHRDMLDDLDNRISLVEAAALLGVHRATVTRWATSGRLRTIRIGRRVFTTLRDVRAMIDSSSQAPGP